MKREQRGYWKAIAFGFGLVFVGALLPFLMVMGILASTFLLAFISVASSVVGLFIGLLVARDVYSTRRKKGD
jgi:uncharacterized membrane protein HdeD (DUF308 family)